jgi:hypothetical protein
MLASPFTFYRGAALIMAADLAATASWGMGRSEVFDRAIVAFARAYADQNERDHQALVDAVRTGRVEAETGV